jgi:uncharacterized protein (DUF736 family)
MSIIGSFLSSDDEFSGRLRTFTLDLPVQIVPINAPTERGPHYRLMANGVEVGAGWKRTARDSGREYLSIKFDDPGLPAPVYANLIASDEGDVLYLVWTRFTPS